MLGRRSRRPADVSSLRPQPCQDGRIVQLRQDGRARLVLAEARTPAIVEAVVQIGDELVDELGVRGGGAERVEALADEDGDVQWGYAFPRPAT